MIIVIIIAVCLIVCYALYLWYTYKKYQETKNKPQINSQRERYENRQYELVEDLVSDPEQFTDTNKLVIQFPFLKRYEGENNNLPNLSFFESLGINPRELQEKNEAFCLMPFNNIYKDIYESIKYACKKQNIFCTRSDEYTTPGNLLRQILMAIIQSKYVFAVLDGRNPNVFYEIGLSHAMGKPVYLIAHIKDIEKLPFDVKSARLILYKNLTDLKAKLEKILSDDRQ